MLDAGLRVFGKERGGGCDVCATSTAATVHGPSMYVLAHHDIHHRNVLYLHLLNHFFQVVSDSATRDTKPRFACTKRAAFLPSDPHPHLHFPGYFPLFPGYIFVSARAHASHQ